MKTKKEASRITLNIHSSLRKQAVETLAAMGFSDVAVEEARCVRQRRARGFFGYRVDMADARTDIFRVTVPTKAALNALHTLIYKLELSAPGQGSIYCQNVCEISGREINDIPIEAAPCPENVLRDLTLIMGIQSKSSSSESLYNVALKLGAAVPIVTLGVGTGIRDRLGLLRITISPEKELIHLMVPSHDANGLQRLLIEEGHLNRAGGGFLYQTPIEAGVVDPLVRIGLQEHAAGIEQIIAAIDDIKKSTRWRKRFFGVEQNAFVQHTQAARFTHKEITLQCLDEHGDDFICAAMNCGAKGATTTHMRLIHLKGDQESERIENIIICASAEREKDIINALINTAEENNEKDWVIQTIKASSVFAYKR